MERKAQLEKELKRITDSIIHSYNPRLVILFGSLSSGKIHEWSDIDLAIVKETKKRFIDRIGEVLQLVKPQVGLHVIVYTPEEVKQMESSDHYFWTDEITKKGKIIYERPA